MARGENKGKAMWIFAVVLAGLIVAHQANGDESLSTILQGVRAKYCSAPGLAMAYRREVTTRSMSMLGGAAKGDLATGRIYYRPPYNLRVEQETPREEVLVTNGETLWWHIPEEQATHHYPFDQHGRELRVLGDIFRGLAAIEESFRIDLTKHDPQAGSILELRPDPPWEQIDHIRVDLSRGYDITGVEIHNLLGTTTRFDLKDIRPRSDFPQDFFRMQQ